MQTRSEEYRAQAAECQELANRYGDLIKYQYEQLALQWLFLAAREEASDGRVSLPLLRAGRRAWLALSVETGGRKRADAALVLKPATEGSI